MNKTVLSLIILSVTLYGVSAQNHNSVPVEETELYSLLKIAEISGLIDRLPGARPYTASLITKALRQIDASRYKLSDSQKDVLDDYIERYVENPDKPFLEDMEIRFEHDVFPLSWRMYLESEARVDLANPSHSGIHNIAAGEFKGSLGRNISYGFRISGQVNKVNIYPNDPYPYAWEPYNYSKVWDGGARYLRRPSPQYLMPREWALGWSLQPEIVFSFLENRVDLRFGRLRRDWGFGKGGLFLDEQARPFMAFDGSLTPWDWLSFNFIVGTLEYAPIFRNSPFKSDEYPSIIGADDYSIGIREISTVQQNMFSLFLLEIRPTKWLYIGLWDAVVYLKRFEPGYMFPFMSKLLSQNNIGDWDNLLFGGTLSFSWSGVGRLWTTLLLDEWNPTINLRNLRNQMAIQAGIEATIPMDIWNLVRFQYTKVEPFTYTHYAISASPWYNSPDHSMQMETGYQNNGENLGSYLEPNSDEFLLSIYLQPAREWTANVGYRLIRHGTGNGSTYRSWGYVGKDGKGGPDDDKDGAYYSGAPLKDFLKDGIYEWTHIFSLGGTLTIRNSFIPISIGLKYSFVYEFKSDYKSQSDFSPINDSQEYRHLIALTIRLF